MSKSPFEQATSDWMALSQQFLNAWQEGAQSMTGMSARDWMNPIKSMSQPIPGMPGEVAEKVSESMRHFFTMMQQLMPNGFHVMNSIEPGKAFADAIAKAFKEWTPQHNPAVEALQAAIATGAKDFSALMPDLGMLSQPLKQETSQWLALPAFGYFRQKQERNQRLAAAWLDYQDRMQAYNNLMLKASYRGLEKMEGKLGERSEPGRQIESMRALYDLWVDAAEVGFAEVAMSDEFRSAYGELVNAQMRVRASVQTDVEEFCAQFGMPTRSELNSVHQKLASMSRRVRELERALEDAAPARDAREPAPRATPAPARKAVTTRTTAVQKVAVKAARKPAASKPSKAKTLKAKPAVKSIADSFASMLAAKRNNKKKGK